MKSSTDGTSVLVILFILFLIFKVTGVVSWSWWVVFTPLMLPFAVIALVIALLFVVLLIVGIVAISGGAIVWFFVWISDRRWRKRWKLVQADIARANGELP